MADKTISQLTSASTPLAGTELLPIVQSNTTKKVAVSDFTAGRSISAAQVTLSSDNLVVATPGKGIDFSANGGDVLSQYDEGTWTPTFSGWSTNPIATGAFYTRVGRQVTINLLANKGVTSGAAVIAGLPFVSNALQGASVIFVALSSAFSTTSRGLIKNSSSQIDYISAVDYGTDYWCMSVTYIV